MDEPVAGPSRECKTPRKRRSRVSITNEFSSKRQRVSIGSIDVQSTPLPKAEFTVHTTEPRADRFITARPEILFPINTTPRTKRIAQVFGLADDRLLKFTDSPTTSPDSKMLTALRRSVSQLFYSPSVVPLTSSSANLAKRRQFILALDGPGIPQDPWAYPLTWSDRNVIAVACGHDVYYQNLDTRQISHLCNLPTASHGRIRTIAFAQGDMPDVVCMGTTTGNLQVWDTASEKLLRKWPNHDWMGVSALDWHDRECTIGRMDGRIALYDLRQRDAVFKIKAHREDVYGLKWSPDGRHLVSSDVRGSVFIWDHRNLCEFAKKVGKMKHGGSVKAVAWCPWKTDLLATGGTYPDGTIQIWSTATLTTSPSPTPLHTIPLDSSIYSLQWSPHCKELLSTHGLSWQGSRGERLPSKVDPIASPLTNSITVHSYPSLNRLVSVTAHTGTVGQSCLGPDGTMVFTICYREEAMKMWKVWGQREESDKRESTFDRCSIR